MSSAPRTILITGCSSGIGLAAAKGLKARGWRVFATTRSPDDCDWLKAEGFEALRLDYDDPATIEMALDAILRRTDGTLDAVFHNGGYAQIGALEDLTTDLIRDQFETNFFGWHELTRRVVPIMRRQGSGRIVFCSSVLGYLGARFRGAYVASKFAVEGMADTLRMELAGTGIHVVLVEPGPVDSKFRARALEQSDRTVDVETSFHRDAYQRSLAQRTGGESSSRFRKPPEAVVAKLVKALEAKHPAARYRVTAPAQIGWYLRRLLPTRALDWVLSRRA